MPKVLSIDIETYSDVDIKNGAYRYIDTDNFEILLIGYAFDDDPVTVVDLACGDTIPKVFTDAVWNPNIEKHAFNATFERICLSKYIGKTCQTMDSENGKWSDNGFEYLDPKGWWCTQKHAAMFGLPSSLKDVGKALQLDEQKDTAGVALINYFCKPCRPTKANCGRTRNLPMHDPDKWALFKKYNAQDVITERAISKYLNLHYKADINEEKLNYQINEHVNDTGVLIDQDLCNAIIDYNKGYEVKQLARYKELTGISSPRQVLELKKWLDRHGVCATSITKDTIPEMIASTTDKDVIEALTIRSSLSKTSVSKYQRMMDAMCSDGRVHGVMNFYGANRTGRFASRTIQVQNLPHNNMNELEDVRTLVKRRDWTYLEAMYDDIQDVFKQLVRTAIIAPANMTFSVADYSAIEARVIAWLAHETETEKLFAPDGSQKIYESTASRMFNVSIETIAKGKENYDLRQRGKVATLACGYGGGVAAMRRMDTKHMLDSKSDEEVGEMVGQWRKANPHIVKLWKDCESSAKEAIETGKDVNLDRLTFRYDGHNLFIQLPSGRWLTYFNCRIDKESSQIMYSGDDVHGWCDHLHTYSGKLVENIVQGIARDCLCGSIQKLHDFGFRIIFHVHDEIICEVFDENNANGKNKYLSAQERLMTEGLGTWDKGMYHPAPGYTSKFYMKD